MKYVRRILGIVAMMGIFALPAASTGTVMCPDISDCETCISSPCGDLAEVVECVGSDNSICHYECGCSKVLP